MNRGTKARVPSRGVKLGFWQKRTLYGATFLLWATGALWLYQSAQPLWMRIHGAAAMGFLMAFGALLLRHVPQGWREKRQRPSGVLLIGLIGTLMATGWGLYYMVDRQFRDWIGRIHWVIGLLLPVMIILHIVLGRRTNVQRVQP